eukprot:gene20602-22634_t
MEHKARKYCKLYRAKPAHAIARMYKELSQNIINGLSVLLTDWCSYAAENDAAARLDLLIPLDWQQLYDFTSELLSYESNETLTIAKAVRVLKNQHATMTSLVSLAQVLRACETRSVDSLVLMSTINARVRKDSECLRYLSMALECSRNLGAACLRSRLYLLSVADLELLKLTIESNRRQCNIGTGNQGYNREDSFEFFVEDGANHIEEAVAKHSATTSLPKTEIKKKADATQAGLAKSQLDSIYDEVNQALSHLTEIDVFLDSIIQAHLDANRPYVAVWLSLDCLNEKQQLPRIKRCVSEQLHAFVLTVISDMLEIIKQKDVQEELSSDLMRGFRERTVRYSKLALCLMGTKDDDKTNLLYLKCLHQNQQISEALKTAQKLLQGSNIVTDNRTSEILRIVAYCKIFLSQYEEALDVIDTIAASSKGCVELWCVRGFALCLADKLEQGICDVMCACTNGLSTTVLNFRSFKQADQEKIRYNITEYIKEKIASEYTKGCRAQIKEPCNINSVGCCCNRKSEKNAQDLVTFCEFLTTLYKGDLKLHLLFVDVLLRMQRYSEAQKTLVLFIKSVPDDPLPMIHLANIRMRLGAYVAAVDDLRVIMRALGCAKFSTYMTHLCAEDRHDIARVLRKHAFQHLQHQRYADAIECFNIAIIAIRDVTTTTTAATGLVLVRAFSFANLGDYELALTDFNTVLDAEPGNFAARLGSAVVYAVLNYDEECVESVSQVLCDDTNLAVQVLEKLSLNCVVRFTSTIESYIRQQLEIYVPDAVAQKPHGAEIAVEQNQSDDEYDNENDEILNRVGSYIEFLGQLHQKSTEFISLHAQYLIMRGDYEGALEQISLGLRLASDDSRLLSKKGLVKMKMSKLQEAMDIWKEIAVDKDDGGRDKKLVKNTIKKLTIDERTEIPREAVRCADHLCDEANYKEANKYYGLALVAAENDSSDIDILRSRFVCLLNDGLVQAALNDISVVIEKKPKYNDYCKRAKLLDDMGKQKAACSDFIMALEMDEENTVAFLVDEALLKHVLCMFCSASSSAFVQEQHQDVLKYCEYGLKLDPNHKGMKQLRYRSKCIMNKCTVQ